MDDEYSKTLAAALKLINYCDRTKAELHRKLIDKEMREDVIEDVIEKLESEGFINDSRYAEYYIICYSDKRSKRRIARELSEKGISDVIIEECIDECNDVEALRNALDKQLRKRGLSVKDNISVKEREKIAAALYRQGFEGKDILLLIGEMCNS